MNTSAAQSRRAAITLSGGIGAACSETMTVSPTQVSSTEETVAFAPDKLNHHLRNHACRYFADLNAEATNVTLTYKSERLNSAIYEYRLSDGRSVHNVIVKVPFGVAHTNTCEGAIVNRTATDGYPRLYPRADHETKGALEFQALTAICQYFSANDFGGRFGSIRPLELLNNPNILILEKRNEPNLRTLMSKSSRVFTRHRPFDRKRIANNAGQWLKHFHGMPFSNNVPSRTSERQDFILATQRLTLFLANTTGKATRFHRIERLLVTLAEQRLPKQLPLGLGHGDFAPRNILVGTGDCVTILDTMARWRTPIYEDISQFLHSTKTMGAQVSSLGFWHAQEFISDLERSFLQGYFDDGSIPLTEIRLFECLLTLERWAAKRSHVSAASGFHKVRARGGSMLWNRHLSRYLDQMIAELEHANRNERMQVAKNRHCSETHSRLHGEENV